MEKAVKLLDGVSAKKDGFNLTLKGAKGEVTKSFASAQVDFDVNDGKVIFKAPKDSRKYRAVMGTFVAHLKNMQKGASQTHNYLLRVCSGHFPMNVAITKDEFTVKNFLGERVPRKMPLPKGVTVKLNGRDITIESTDKDLAGKVASRIEKLTLRSNYDRRVFQDGIYIVNKDGKEVR